MSCGSEGKSARLTCNKLLGMTGFTRECSIRGPTVWLLCTPLSLVGEVETWEKEHCWRTPYPLKSAKHFLPRVSTSFPRLAASSFQPDLRYIVWNPHACTFKNFATHHAPTIAVKRGHGRILPRLVLTDGWMPSCLRFPLNLEVLQYP